jgi:AraC-like DNA-binding protein
MPVSVALVVSDFILNLFVLLLLYTEGHTTKTRKFVLAIVLLQLFAQVPPLVLAMSGSEHIRLFEFLPFRHWVFLVGPFIYFYARSCMGKPLKKTMLWHLVPFLFWYGLYLAVPADTLRGIYGLTNVVSLLGYSLVILHDINQYRSELKEQYSYTSVFMELSWLSSIMKALIGIVLLLFVLVSISPRWFPLLVRNGNHLLLDGRNPEFITTFHSIAILAFTFVFSFFALKQNRIHVDILPQKARLSCFPVRDPDRSLFETLEAYMEKEKPYLDSTLTLQALSDATAIPRNELSRIINAQAKENFFQYVNGYRAREFEQAVDENRYPNYTLLGIALECGFNSKATFNAAVKRNLGKTPSQVRSASKIGPSI